MKPKPTLASCFLFLLLSISATAKERAPSWVTDWKSAFPNSVYIAQLGSGKNADIARANALSAIATYLKSNVQANVYTNYSTYNDKEYTETHQDVLIASQVELYGMEFTEPYKNKKTWYCVAYINRDKTWAQLLPDIQAKEAVFLTFMRKADSEPEPFLACSYYNDAAQKTGDFFTALAYGRLIKNNADNFFVETITLANAIPSLIATRKKSASVQIICVEDTDAIIRNAIAKRIEEAGFTVANNGCCIAEAKIELNLEGNDPVSITPSLTLAIRGKTGKTVHSFQCHAEERTAAYSLETAKRRAFPKLAASIDNQFLQGY